MQPETAIVSINDLLAEINRLRARLADEAGEIEEQWYALGLVGGQRADHAAQILGRLRPHLSGLSRFAQDVEAQIARMQADPFGRLEKAS